MNGKYLLDTNALIYAINRKLQLPKADYWGFPHQGGRIRGPGHTHQQRNTNSHASDDRAKETGARPLSGRSRGTVKRNELLRRLTRRAALLFLRKRALAGSAAEQKNRNAKWKRIWPASAANTIEHIYPQKPGIDD